MLDLKAKTSYIFGVLGIISVLWSFLRILFIDTKFLDSAAVWIDILVLLGLGIVFLSVCYRLSASLTVRSIVAYSMLAAGMLLALYGAYKIYKFLLFYNEYAYSRLYWTDLAIFFAGGLLIKHFSNRMLKSVASLKEDSLKAKKLEEEEVIRKKAKERCYSLLSADPSLSIEALAENSGVSFTEEGEYFEYIVSIVKELVYDDKFPEMYFNPETNRLAYLNNSPIRAAGGDGYKSVICQGCGALTRVKKGASPFCEYCGSNL